MYNIKKRKPGEVFLDIEGKIVVTFNGLKMKNIDSGEITNLKKLVNQKLITDLQVADSTIRTSPDNHVAYSNKARCLTELALKVKNGEYYGFVLLHYTWAIDLAEYAGDHIQKATYFSRKAKLLLLNNLKQAIEDITTAKTIIATEEEKREADKAAFNNAEIISIKYVRGSALNITKLQYVREKIEVLSNSGLISSKTKTMLLEEYEAFTDALLAAGADDSYKVKILALEEKMGSVEERQAFHEYDINLLRDNKANVEDALDKIQALVNDGNSINPVQVSRHVDYLSRFPSMAQIVEMVTELLNKQEQKIEKSRYLHIQEQINQDIKMIINALQNLEEQQDLDRELLFTFCKKVTIIENDINPALINAATSNDDFMSEVVALLGSDNE